MHPDYIKRQHRQCFSLPRKSNNPKTTELQTTSLMNAPEKKGITWTLCHVILSIYYLQDQQQIFTLNSDTIGVSCFRSACLITLIN